jgi:PIN domain nuclease of toxin-antitoxin system
LLSRLPVPHGDPPDSLLVSQANVHGLTIPTAGALLTQYPARTLL